MRSRLHAPTLAVGVSLATCLVTARADVMPEAEYDSQEIDAVTELSGASRFPEHAFYVFPAYCTEALAKFSASLASGDENPEFDPRFLYEDQYDGRPNYLVVSDGTLPRWTSGDTPCISSTLYSLAREVAAGVDLDDMQLAEMHRFFTEDPRVLLLGGESPRARASSRPRLHRHRTDQARRGKREGSCRPDPRHTGP